MAPLDTSHPQAPGSEARSLSSHRGRLLGFVPLVFAMVVTLVLGGASVSRALSFPPLDAHTDLEFSLDGSTWSDAPDEVLGSWGCDLDEPFTTSPGGPISGTAGVDPCAMSPGEYIDRTYFVRNSTNSGRPGLYEVGIGDFELSSEAEFSVSSAITGLTGADSNEVTLFGDGTAQADQTPARGSRLAALQLAPGAEAKVVDTVSVPATP